MPEQRSERGSGNRSRPRAPPDRGEHSGSDGVRTSRRSYLAALAAGTAAVVGGCAAGARETVTVLSAGSLAATFEDFVRPAFREETGIDLRGEYHGTNAALRMVQDGTHHPDVVVGADATLLRDRLYDAHADWDVEFATNSLGLGYVGDSGFAARLDGAPWYEAVRALDGGELAVSDPDLDPLGYRAVMAFELAAREHGLDGLRGDLLGRAYVEPEEPQLLAGVETGTRTTAVVYRNMAADHGLAFEGFPDAYDFSEPELADHYATVSYTTDDGYTARGRPIVYNATVPSDADAPENGRRLVEFLVENPSVLDRAGLTVGDPLPRAHGSPPEGIGV